MDFLKHMIERTYYNYRRYNKHDYGFHGYRGRGSFMGIFPEIQYLLSKSKKLLYVLIAVIGLALLLLITLLIVIFPMILSGIDWVYQNGINGIVNLLLTTVDKIWKGAGS